MEGIRIVEILREEIATQEATIAKHEELVNKQKQEMIRLEMYVMEKKAHLRSLKDQLATIKNEDAKNANPDAKIVNSKDPVDSALPNSRSLFYEVRASNSDNAQAKTATGLYVKGAQAIDYSFLETNTNYLDFWY